MCDERTVERTDVKENIQIQIAEDSVNNATSDVEKQEKHSVSNANDESSDESELNYETASDTESNAEDLAERFTKLVCNPADLEIEGEGKSEVVVDDILAPVDATKSEDEQSDVESIEAEDDDDGDDGGWITPSINLILYIFCFIKIHAYPSISGT